MSENQMDVNATESKMKCVGKAIVIAFLSLVFVLVGFCSLCCYIVNNHAVKAELKTQSDESYLTVPVLLVSTNSPNVRVMENNADKITHPLIASIDIGCIDGAVSYRLPLKFSILLLIGGFGLPILIIVWILVFLGKFYRAYVKMDFAMRNRQDVWQKCSELLEKSTGVVNQHWCNLNMQTQASATANNNVPVQNNPPNNNPNGAGQVPLSVSFGDGLTCSGGSSVSVGLPIGTNCGHGNSINKPQPVIHADYKVIETMLEILADNPSHALV